MLVRLFLVVCFLAGGVSFGEAPGHGTQQTRTRQLPKFQLPRPTAERTQAPVDRKSEESQAIQDLNDRQADLFALAIGDPRRNGSGDDEVWKDFRAAKRAYDATPQANRQSSGVTKQYQAAEQALINYMTLKGETIAILKRLIGYPDAHFARNTQLRYETSQDNRVRFTLIDAQAQQIMGQVYFNIVQNGNQRVLQLEQVSTEDANLNTLSRTLAPTRAPSPDINLVRMASAVTYLNRNPDEPPKSYAELEYWLVTEGTLQYLAREHFKIPKNVPWLKIDFVRPRKEPLAAPFDSTYLSLFDDNTRTPRRFGMIGVHFAKAPQRRQSILIHSGTGVVVSPESLYEQARKEYQGETVPQNRRNRVTKEPPVRKTNPKGKVKPKPMPEPMPGTEVEPDQKALPKRLTRRR